MTPVLYTTLAGLEDELAKIKADVGGTHWKVGLYSARSGTAIKDATISDLTIITASGVAEQDVNPWGSDATDSDTPPHRYCDGPELTFTPASGSVSVAGRFLRNANGTLHALADYPSAVTLAAGGPPLKITPRLQVRSELSY